jgi:outer membrane protein OmpA-like peptidoglycan-associated protein
MPSSAPVLLIPWLLVLGSCSSPPKPPTVDESNKRPVNSTSAIELQTCRSDLQATRLQTAEALRAAEAAHAQRLQLQSRQYAEAIARVQATIPTSAPANGVFTVRFDFGSTKVSIPAEVAASLVDEARASPLIVLKGRTDGTSDDPGESRIARLRAEAVRDALIAAGIDATRIRTTYQPAGDHAADNTAPAGRAMNRRVEIELYRAEPVNLASTTTTAAHRRD